MATERRKLPRRTPFDRWVLDEGLKVVQQQLIPDVRSVKLEPWERTGTNAALIDLTPGHDGRQSLLANQGTSRYLCEIPAGGTYKAERHIYEEIFFVVSGRGATTVWYPGSRKHTFEWHEGSVFSIPLNAWHEHYNGSGDTRVLLYAAFTAPIVFNLYDSPPFILDCEATFPERFDPDDETYFSGKETKIQSRLMKTNFISSVGTWELDDHSWRGPSLNMNAVMANGFFVCHVSESAPRSYKKAHTGAPFRTRAGINSDVAYLFLSGEGYDLQWAPEIRPGVGVPFEILPYKQWSLLSPGGGYHQHFNTTAEPIRYLVLRRGNPELAGDAGGQAQDAQMQIHFEDEDPAVWELFVSELHKRGLEPDMDAWRKSSAADQVEA